MTEEQRLSYLINQHRGTFSPNIQVPKFFECLKNNPHALVVRFENLVGPKGSGSEILQKNEVKRIANYLELTVSDEEIEEVCQKLFGGTKTFKKGQIGTWKSKFP